MEEFSIGASVVQWLTTGYLLLLSVSISSSPFMVRKFATKTCSSCRRDLRRRHTAGRARGQLPDAARRPTGHVARHRHLLVAHHQHHSGKAPLEQRGSMLGIVSLVTCAAPAIGPVFGGVLKSHFPPKFIIIGFAGTVIMDAVFVTLSGNVWVVAIAANDGADAAGSYMIAFPRSMMVFAGMAVLGVILASLMFRFSTRRPPEMREVK